MLTIENDVQEEIVINKSIFITNLVFVETKIEAIEKLAYFQTKYQDANHNCYAYIVGSDVKASDDGEPSGTAGVPMLEVLKKNQLENVLVVVTRYFGGIKLGAGGLVRAYSKGVSQAIKATKIVERIEINLFTIQFGYEYLDIVNNFIKQNNLSIGEQQYIENVLFTLYNLSDELIDKLKDVTNHEVIITTDKKFIVKDDCNEKFI